MSDFLNSEPTWWQFVSVPAVIAKVKGRGLLPYKIINNSLTFFCQMLFYCLLTKYPLSVGFN